MAIFSVNQVRQLYVVNSVVDYQSTSLPSAAGAIRMQTQGGYMWFDHYGPAGLTRSDIINLEHLKSFKAIKSSTMATTLQKKLITVSSSALSSSATIAGQDYILKTEFPQWGASGLENLYYKYAVVRGNGTDNAAAFYKKLYDSLVMNFQKETVPLFKFGIVGTVGGLTIYAANHDYTFKVDTGETATALANGIITIGSSGNSTAAHFNADIATAGLDNLIYVSAVGSVTGVSSETELTYTGVVIEEEAQPWELGSKSFSKLYFNLLGNKITLSTGEEVGWLTITDSSVNTTTVGNGKLMADLEWFCLGERADVYRGIGGPYYPKSAGLVSPTDTYSLIELSYSYHDQGVNDYASDKTVTLAVKDGASGSTYTNINLLINDLEAAATAFTVADLS